MKRCPKCGVEKAPSDFPKDKSKRDGLYPMCKACRAPKTRAQYAANQPEERKRRKARYDANPEKFRAEAKGVKDRMRAERPEALRAYHASYYQAHRERWSEYVARQDPEKKRLRAKAYRDANREKVRAGVRDWFRRNPHAAKKASYAYRAKIRDLPPEANTLTGGEIDEILEFFGYRCGYCLVDLRTLPKGHSTIDHMLPIVRGGTNTADNVIPCCKGCNSRKRDRHIAFMAAYH